MLTVPYRWFLRYLWDRITNGVVNVVRFFPLVWDDVDWDWTALVRIMQFKFERLADCHARGYHVMSDRYARQCRVCAELCKRLLADKYFHNAGYDPQTWESTPEARKQWIARHSHAMQKQDQAYLGKLIGKYLTHWWE